MQNPMCLQTSVFDSDNNKLCRGGEVARGERPGERGDGGERPGERGDRGERGA